MRLQEHLFELEADLAIPEAEKPVYVLYADETGGQWRVQAVPVSPDSFASRKALPEVWRGLRDDALSAASGVPEGVFVHASGFIGGECSVFSVQCPTFRVRPAYGSLVPVGFRSSPPSLPFVLLAVCRAPIGLESISGTRRLTRMCDVQETRLRTARLRWRSSR